MRRTRHTLTSSLLAGALGGATAAVLRRMEGEYNRTDTLSPSTVAAMYATYGAHVAALGGAARLRVWPLRLPARPCRTAGTLLAASGGGIALAGATPFGAGKQISGVEPGTLHARGIYRYSRNPQYVGLGLAAAGVALATRSAFAGLLAGGIWVAYRRWIPSEERHLTRTFGTGYTRYLADTPRWIGMPRTSRAEARPSRPQPGTRGRSCTRVEGDGHQGEGTRLRA